MKKIKFKFNILKEIYNFNNYLINLFNKISKIKSNKFSKISKFSKILIISISLLFFYLFYLSIPSLYNKGSLQKDLASKLLKEFNINFSVSSEISYSILPSPHFLVKNAKIFKADLENPKELVQIKELKIFFSQKNLFKQNKLTITQVLVKDANFFITKKDFVFFKNYFREKFSEKKILVKNVTIFFKDKNDETISIFSILESSLFFNKKKEINQIISKGNIYQNPFKLEWIKNFSGEITRTTLLEFKKLNLKIKNISTEKQKKYLGKNQLFILGKKINFNYEIDNNFINFNSSNLELQKNEVEYFGKIKLDPFNFKIDITFNQLNMKKFLEFRQVIEELLKTNLFFNKNLNGYISINSKNLSKSKLFDSMRVLFNFDNGKINLNNSNFTSDKIGLLSVNNSSMETINNELVLRGDYNFRIDDQNKFYKVFQIPKSSRKKINNIYFDLEYNMFNKDIKILDFAVNELDGDDKDNIIEYLDEYNSRDKKDKIENWIDFKIFVNNIIQSYFG